MYVDNRNEAAQVSHFIARFKRAMKELDSFAIDNMGVIDKSNLTNVWDQYDSLEQLVNANRNILASGDRTDLFAYSNGHFYKARYGLKF